MEKDTQEEQQVDWAVVSFRYFSHDCLRCGSGNIRLHMNAEIVLTVPGCKVEIEDTGNIRFAECLDCGYQGEYTQHTKVPVQQTE